jgi:plasmid maintenance system antidote protein VapI
MLNATTVRPEDLRAYIGRHRIVVYRLAAIVGVSPSRLSSVLNERSALTPALAAKLVEVLNRDEAQQP